MLHWECTISNWSSWSRNTLKRSSDCLLKQATADEQDPKEYLPFLRELRELDKWEQRFRIDDHLGRKELALKALQQAGESKATWDTFYVA